MIEGISFSKDAQIGKQGAFIRGTAEQFAKSAFEHGAEFIANPSGDIISFLLKPLNFLKKHTGILSFPVTQPLHGMEKKHGYSIF